MTVSRTPSGNVYPTDAITLSATASGNPGINSINIYFKQNQGSWQSTQCTATSCSFFIGSMPLGTTVLYYATAQDSAEPSNEVNSGINTFTITPSAPSATSGNLLTYIYDCGTNAPIPGAFVSVSGANPTYITNYEGFANLPATVFSQASAISYNSNNSCSCIPVPSSSKSIVPITLLNTGVPADFSLSLYSPYTGLYASPVQSSVFGLGNSNWRTEYLNIQTNSLAAGNYTLALTLNTADSGATVYSTNVCVYVQPNQAATAQFVPSTISMAVSQQAQVQLQLTNTGNTASAFVLTPVAEQIGSITLGTNQLTLSPGQTGTVYGQVTTPGSAAIGTYPLPVQITTSGSLVQTATLALNLVPYRQVIVTPLSGIQASMQSNSPLPTTGSTLVPILVQNNNLYPQEQATVYFDSLPAGVVSSVAGPFTVPALGSSIQFVTLTTSGVTPGFYPAVLNVQSTTDSSQSNVHLPIGISYAPLLVTVGTPAVSYAFTSGTDVQVQFAVTNNELGALNLTAYVDGMPAGWTQQSTPGFAIVGPGGNATFGIALHSDSAPSSDYNASLVVLSSTGRLSRTPVQISPLSASNATGLFTWGSSNVILAAILGLLILAAVLFYMARDRLETASTVQRPS